MQWISDAIILSSRKHGEHSLIVQTLTKNHGIHAGLLRSARKASAVCQAGNLVEATWKARISEHLGTYSFEPKKTFFAYVLDDPLKLLAITSACSLIETCLPERAPHPEVFSNLLFLLEALKQDKNWLQHYVFLELELLQHLGYGLDLMSCAATGERNSLMFVSPKSGRAVSEVSGEPYRQKLLHLPPFLRPQGDSSYSPVIENIREIIDGMLLTRYFLEKHIFGSGNNKMPNQARMFAEKLQGCLS